MMDLEQKAIERIKYAEQVSFQLYGLPPVLCYSGGKDSDVLLELTWRAGIAFEVNHNHTTVDAPETVYHIREVVGKLETAGIKSTITMPFYKSKRTSMWKLIEDRLMPPTRTVRYCCSQLKETFGYRRLIMTGVRWSESKKRESRGALEQNAANIKDRQVFTDDNEENRRLFEQCVPKSKTTINPIIDWSGRDVFSFAKSEKIQMNPLYECGFERVGCIGCPLAGKIRWKQFRLYPTYEQAYRRAFSKMLVARNAAGKETSKWQTADDVFRWWMEDKNLDGQLAMDGTIIGQ